MVGRRGLEPLHLSVLGSKPSMYTIPSSALLVVYIKYVNFTIDADFSSFWNQFSATNASVFNCSYVNLFAFFIFKCKQIFICIYINRLLYIVASGAGFEPAGQLWSPNAFPRHLLKPLGHPDKFYFFFDAFTLSINCLVRIMLFINFCSVVFSSFKKR